MEYKVIRHAWGNKQEKHKYIERIQLPKRPGMKYNNYRYFYDRPSYIAYLKNQTGQTQQISGLNESKNLSRVISDLFSKKTAITGAKAVEKGVTAVMKNVASSKKEIKETVKVAKAKAVNVQAKGEKFVKTYLNKNKAKKVVEQSKEKIDKIQDKGKQFVNKQTSKLKEVQKAVNKVEKKATKIESKGKDYIDKHVDKSKPMSTVGNSEVEMNGVKEFISTALKTGIGNAIGTIVADIVYDLLDKADDVSDKWDELIEPEEPKEEMVKPTSFAELPRKTREYSKDEDMALINPNYETYEWEYTNNCSYCTTAYEFRQRGYDVEVAPISETDDPTYTSELASWFEGAEVRGYMDIVTDNDPLWMLRKADINDIAAHSDLIIKELESHGEGARGNLCVNWKDYNSGHSIVWEVENGEVIFRDCQTNQKVENHEIKDYLARTSYVEYFRTDNLEFSEEALKTVRYKRKAD